ncbi:cation-translocating P-type ATPase [Pseudorhizobium endolithicum]|nr:HAD-IC family P-type ATPase [Pseudorhizobium endolithicum]
MNEVVMQKGGLTASEAADRLERFGPNLLPEPAPPSFLMTFLLQFRSPLIYILLVAAAVAAAVGELEDSFFIGIVLVLNGIVGGIQEHSAGRAAAALRKLEEATAMVVRDGATTAIPARLVVPGDLILLEAGARVAADVDVFEATDLQCDESLLTGESAPVKKIGGGAGADRVSAFAGTLVTRGRGRGIVVATGMASEIGRIAAELGKESSAKPPLMIRLAKFSNRIAWLVGAAMLFLILVGQFQGIGWGDLFLMAVGLAVSAIPEGLPVAISVALAISMRRMARKHVIVRRMPAVESLGSCTMIATDKTGTLTLNELTVTDIVLPDGSRFECEAGPEIDACRITSGGNHDPSANERVSRLFKAASMPNEGVLVRDENGWTGIGDTVDVALLAAARKAGLEHQALADHYPLLTRIPYEPDLKYAASFHRRGDVVRVFAKGSPETLIAMADRMDVGTDFAPVDRAALLRQKEEMASQGLRVLAFASGEISSEDGDHLGPHHLVHLVFLGMVGMQDPIRPEVPQAVADCRSAGVDIAMVTGDDPRTAAAIARDAGLSFDDDQVVTGREVQAAEEAGDEGLDTLTRRARIYARVAPAQKLSIVRSLARNGHFVAVTGDGINDAPALKHAHVGVAMGRKGTDVAKESADIVITDDNFSSIVSGIREGRVAYSNIRKVILMLVTTGIAEVLLFILAIPLGLPMPLLPVQLLWLNLVTNGIQDVALAGEKSEGDELRRPPRKPREPIFDRIMIRRIVVTVAVMGLGGFALFYWLLAQGYEVGQARNLLLLLFVMFENVQTFTSRSERRSIFSIPFFGNPLLLITVIAAQGLHIAAMYIPWLRDTLELSPISMAEWAVMLIAATSILIVTELDKWRLGRSEKKAEGGSR